MQSPTPKTLVRLRAARTPVYAQIEEQVAEVIEAGGLRPGDRLPTERELARQLGISRMTLRQALDRLERRGLLVRIVGRGTFVAEPKLERDLRQFIGGLSAQLRRLGLSPSATVLDAREQRPPRATALALGLSGEETVYEIDRLRLADGEPLVLERSAFPAAHFPGLLECDLEGSMYDLLDEQYGARPVRA